MRKSYDFSNAKPNPYAKLLKRQDISAVLGCQFYRGTDIANIARPVARCLIAAGRGDFDWKGVFRFHGFGFFFGSGRGGSISPD